MTSRLSETDHAMELQRLEAMNERMAGLEAGIQRLKEQGQPTVEAERLLHLLRQSSVAIPRHVHMTEPSS
jgi:hypothetical protein